MGVHPSPALRSYAKTTLGSLGIFVAATVGSLAALNTLPGLAGSVLAALSAIAAIGAAVLFSACMIVLLRYRRDATGAEDLFLLLNRSREPAAIESGHARRVGRLRRWLAQRMLGHDLIVGDLVEIKRWSEIRATLDEKGRLEQLPFMPEMLRMCGQRAYVFRCMHRLFDYRKTRRMRYMSGAVLLVGATCDGTSHGGCDATCHTIWKAAWLRRVDRSEGRSLAPATAEEPVSLHDIAVIQTGTQGPLFRCQLTELSAASQPTVNWSPQEFLRPLLAGNVAPAAFIVAWLTHLFNTIQHHRQGVSFPEFEACGASAPSPDVRLKAGDEVVVRSRAEIRSTLDDRLTHRGMGFEEDMLKYCGRRMRVKSEIAKVIDIVTGEMRTMKTPAYILRGAHFSGERQLFNAQYEPLFWRGAWLRQDHNGSVPSRPAAQDVAHQLKETNV